MTQQIIISDETLMRLQAISDNLKSSPDEILSQILDDYNNIPDCCADAVPNAETIKAMQDGKQGKNLTKHTSLESLFKSWEEL